MQRTLLIAGVAIASLHLVAPPTQGREDRITALEARVDKLESSMASRDHLILMSAASVFNRMDLACLERTGKARDAEVAKLHQHMREVIGEGSKIITGIQRLLERDRVLLALKNYHAAVDLRSDVYHRIRILREQKIGDGPHAGEKRRRREAGIKRWTGYMQQTPDPEKVRAHLKSAEKR